MTEKQSSLAEALQRAYYFTETGDWRWPEIEESERWHAVSMVAMDHALKMVRAALAEAQPVEVPEMTDVQIGTVALEQWGLRGMRPPSAHRQFARAIIDARDAMWREALNKQKV